MPASNAHDYAAVHPAVEAGDGEDELSKNMRPTLQATSAAWRHVLWTLTLVLLAVLVVPYSAGVGTYLAKITVGRGLMLPDGVTCTLDRDTGNLVCGVDGKRNNSALANSRSSDTGIQELKKPAMAVPLAPSASSAPRFASSPESPSPRPSLSHRRLVSQQNTTSSHLPPPSVSAAPGSSPTPVASKSPHPTPSPSEHWFDHVRRPVVVDNFTFWDGSYDNMPVPVPVGFSGQPSPEAIGRRAFVTMLTPNAWGNRYTCLGLAHVTALKATQPDPSIDIVVLVMLPRNSKHTLDTLPELLGKETYDAFFAAGTTKFVVKYQYDMTGKVAIGHWEQAFSKLRVWELTEYEKVVFLDADVMPLKNLDHLFQLPEFTAAVSWNCLNQRDTKVISGGFWILQPSVRTTRVIEAYIAGRDPCGWRWRCGDMTITRLLFVDVEAIHDPHMNKLARGRHTWPRFDGDVTMYLGGKAEGRTGRCDGQITLQWPRRFDEMRAPTTKALERIGSPVVDDGYKLSPRNRWHSLNESYDLLVGPCGLDQFKTRYQQRMSGDRWRRHDALAVHFSCGAKPSCKMIDDSKLQPCELDMHRRWWGHFTRHAPANLIQPL